MKIQWRFAWVAVLLVAGVLGLIAACGEDEDEVVAPAATATSRPVVSTATSIPPTEVPVATGPTGTLTVAMGDIAVPLFRNGVAPYPRNHFHWGLGVCEILTMWAPGTTDVSPMVASKWEFASDMSELVITVREGIQFHGDWGEVTAEDVAFSYNDAGADNPETSHDNGQEIGSTYDPWFARDTYTAVGPIETVRKKFGEWDITREGFSGAPCIFSKKVFDDVGAEAAVTTMVATGPYEAVKWTSGDRFEGEAVVDHYRIVPNFAKLVVFEVPEESTRVAMMESEQVDIAQLTLKNVKVLEEAGFKVNDSLGLAWTNTIYFAGNFWMEKDAETGEVVFPRPGFKPEKPWIGDPRDADSMESARKVRWAMSMALDREALNDTIQGGLGKPAYMPGIPIDDPMFKDEWIIPFDPEGAKALLAEAGYPDGFEFDYFYPPDFALINPEVAEAVAVMWGDIGLKVNIEATAYTTRRPTMMDRSIDLPWYWFVDMDLVDYDPFNLWLQSARAGWNGGMEFQELWDFRQDLLAAIATGDEAEKKRVVQARGDWIHEQAVYAAVVDLPSLFVQNPDRVTNWNMYMNIAGVANNFEAAEPVSK